MGLRFIKIAVVYLFAGAVPGPGDGHLGKFALAPVHAHLLLLGWASLALAGVVYHLYPAAATTRLATLHFWLHNLGLPVFMAGLAAMLTGTECGAARDGGRGDDRAGGARALRAQRAAQRARRTGRDAGGGRARLAQRHGQTATGALMAGCGS